MRRGAARVDYSGNPAFASKQIADAASPLTELDSKDIGHARFAPAGTELPRSTVRIELPAATAAYGLSLN